MNQTQQGGMVRRFCSYNTAQMAQLKADLGLEMPLSLLNFCAVYLRNSKKARDPSIAELRFWDQLASLPPQEKSITVSELYTNDSFVAVTYADMMNKRRELRPDAKEPISLGEALAMSSAYLERAGKPCRLNGFTPAFGETGELWENSIGIDGASVFLAPKGRRHKPEFAEGDVFLLIQRGREMPLWQYGDAIDGFLNHAAIGRLAKEIFTVPKEGLLHLLLPICDGICYDLRRISPEGYTPQPQLLIRHFGGDRLIATDKKAAEELAPVAKAVGLSVTAIAAVINDPMTRILLEQRDGLIYETSFLRHLVMKKTAVAKLPSERVDVTPDISHRPSTSGVSPYWNGEKFPERLEVNGGGSASAACGRLTQAPFKSAIQTALTALLSTAAAGGNYEESRLGVALACPEIGNDPARMGSVMAAILGLYRLQCELSLPAAITSIISNDALEHLELNVFSISPADPLPSALTEVGNRVYLVSPRLGDDGLPDFEALRALLRELRDHHSKGLIRSARVLCNETLSEALALMEAPRLECKISKPSPTEEEQTFAETPLFTEKFREEEQPEQASQSEEEKIPLAIVLESDGELPYFLVGTVTEKEAAADAPPTVVLPSVQNALNRDGQIEALILSAPQDFGAAALAQRLRQSGFRCNRLNDTATEAQLTRAILHAQLVLVCGAAKLPTDPRVTLAVDFLHRAGGLLIHPGVNGSHGIYDFNLPMGLTAENLRELDPPTFAEEKADTEESDSEPTEDANEIAKETETDTSEADLTGNLTQKSPSEENSEKN